jgi:hypothetical protein
MDSIPNQLAPVLASAPAWLVPLSALLISLTLIFAGRAVVKVIAFLLVGLAGASLGAMLAVQYLSPGGYLVGALLGFVLGGMLGVVAVAVGVGLAIGYGAYLLALDLSLGGTTALIIGVVSFVAGLALSNRLLGLVTALGGGILFFDLLLGYGLGLAFATAIATITTLAGVWVQEDLTRKTPQPTATNIGGQPSDNH